MSVFDIFNNDAFSQVEMINGIERMEFQPTGLGRFFTEKGIRTESVMIETIGNSLQLVGFSQRGAPVEQAKGRDLRNIRSFTTQRLGQGDRITASEIDFVRRFNTEQQVEMLQEELADRWGGQGKAGLINNIELSFEKMYLGALQGKFIDPKTDQVIYDWAAELGSTKPGSAPYTIPTETFDFTTLIDGAFRDKLTKMSRTIARSSEGAWNPSVRFVALCGDTFFDEAIKNKEIRETYRYNVGASQQPVVSNIGAQFGDAFGTIEYKGLTLINYKGTDDNTTLKIPDTEAVMFPTNIPEMFTHVMAHGESFGDLGTKGKKFYPFISRDLQKDRFVDIEILSYPLMLCKYPRMLRKLALV